jgi:hypothetical protein
MDPQDYVVCPEQLWLDGINAGAGTVRQFVAMPLGAGYSVEHGVTGREARGGIQLAVFEPKPGAALKTPEPRPGGPAPRRAPQRMGIGAGGRIAQKIYPDPHGLDVWNQEAPALVHIEILNSEQFLELTGRTPPPSPVDPSAYTAHGLPWFRLYEEHQGDVPASDVLSGVKTVAERDRETGARAPDGQVRIEDNQVVRIRNDEE